MKQLFIILILVCYSTAILAQDFKLFDSNSKKLFSTFPENSTTYSLSFDTVNSAGSDSVYYNFFKIEDLNFVSIDCAFWGGPNCYKQNVPVWIGAKIEFNNQYSYNFYPDNGDTIKFDFTSNSDTNIFYIDSSQKFSLTFERSDTISILNFSDSAYYYKIHHTDLVGNIINSALNGQEIIICKKLGLVRFFQIDEFPLLLNPIELIGQENQRLGIFNITNEMMYDFQVGDEFQYKETVFHNDGASWMDIISYRKHTITERVETTDSLIYTVEEIRFYEDSSSSITNIINRGYSKSEIIAQLPFEKFNGNFHSFYLEDYCGSNLWTYEFDSEFGLSYCAIDDVWGYHDSQGPPSVLNITWVLGIGEYYKNYVSYNGSIQYTSGQIREMIYFKKGDIICGTLIDGISNSELEPKNYQVFPNPVNDQLFFANFNNSNSYSIEIINSLGQKVRVEDNIRSTEYTMNMAELKSGIYFYIIRENGIKVQEGKVIKK